jgi:hypothetical protein
MSAGDLNQFVPRCTVESVSEAAAADADAVGEVEPTGNP